MNFSRNQIRGALLIAIAILVFTLVGYFLS